MSILGLTVAGALIYTTLSITTPLSFTFGTTVIKVQDLFDTLVPGLLGILTTFIVYICVKKNISIVKIMLAMTAIGIAGAFIGII